MKQKPTNQPKSDAVCPKWTWVTLEVRKTSEEKYLQEETEDETIISWGCRVNSSLLTLRNQTNLFYSCRLKLQ